MMNKVRTILTKKAFLLVILVCCFLAYFSDKSSAKTIITIKPMITVSGQLNSNFYKTENDEREVYSYIVRPGIQLGVETAKSKLSFSYALEAYFYDDRSENISPVPSGFGTAEEENYTGHYFTMDASYKLFDRLTIGLSDAFYETRRADRYDDFTDSTSRAQHWINRLTPRISYKFGEKYAAAFRFRQQDIDYADTEIGDSSEHRGVLDLVYNPTRTITFDLEYQRWKLYHDDTTPDYTSDMIKLILQKRWKYFFVEGAGGYHYRSFKGPNLPARDAVILKIAIGGQNPPATGLGRRVYEEDSLKIKSHVYFDYERNFSDLDEFRTDDRFTLSVGHLFWKKIKVGLKGFYTMSDYDNFSGPTPAGNIELRKDDIYGVSASVHYLFKDYLDLSLEAGITDRNSNLAGYSYEDQFVLFNLEFSYPIGSRRQEDTF
jgi:hypothetical protein